jgi:predicted PhzF superfamily epimerase YddE/YHI9
VVELHVLRVFTSEDGTGGNPLGVVLEGSDVPVDRRQRIAAALGFSETVFVDDPQRGEMRIFTPAVELPFAGHPIVGTAWLLARERGGVDVLRTPAGEVPALATHDGARVTVNPAWPPHFDWEKLDGPAEIDGLEGPQAGEDAIGYWAWLDEKGGRVRARVFPVRYGIVEDEATGAAAVRLCALLGREIEIRQGQGSLLRARPGGDGRVELEGRVELDELRELPGVS